MISYTNAYTQLTTNSPLSAATKRTIYPPILLPHQSHPSDISSVHGRHTLTNSPIYPNGNQLPLPIVGKAGTRANMFDG